MFSAVLFPTLISLISSVFCICARYYSYLHLYGLSSLSEYIYTFFNELRTALSLHITPFCDITQCFLVFRYGRFVRAFFDRIYGSL